MQSWKTHDRDALVRRFVDSISGALSRISSIRIPYRRSVFSVGLVVLATLMGLVVGGQEIRSFILNGELFQK